MRHLLVSQHVHTLLRALPYNPRRPASKTALRIVHDPHLLHQPIQALHERQMRRVLLQIVSQVLLALKIDDEAMRVYCL